MNQFTFTYTTQIIFGKDTEKTVGAKIKEFCPKAENVLVVYGSDRIKKNGLLQTVETSLQEQGLHMLECAGVQANPLLGKAKEGIATAKQNAVDFVLAIGGGSVIDTAKTIGCGALYDGDVWDFFEGKAKVERTLPTASILTIPAAGSESSNSSVITKEDGMLKRANNTDKIRCVFSILNPELTYSVPAYQMGAGISDMLAHVQERYFTNTQHVDLTDRMCEAAMKTIINNGLKTYQDPTNYDYRAEIMWAGAVAHNGMLDPGRETDWASHRIGMELSAKYNTTHGATLAIIMPHWMEYVYKHDINRFVQWAVRVWDVDLSYDDPEAIVKEGICRYQAFLHAIGMPLTMTEAGVPTDAFAEMAAKCTHDDKAPVGHFVLCGVKECMSIYELSK
jgi:alcohol dehydrogenase YqhD (iron-dependent ADH family)